MKTDTKRQFLETHQGWWYLLNVSGNPLKVGWTECTVLLIYILYMLTCKKLMVIYIYKYK